MSGAERGVALSGRPTNSVVAAVVVVVVVAVVAPRHEYETYAK